MDEAMNDFSLSIAHPLTHIRYLTEEIGPRGSTTVGEAKAAEYTWKTLRAFGLEEVRVEKFESGRSTWRPYALALVLALLAVIIYPLLSPWSALVAALLCVAALRGMYAELNFDDNPLRRLLPKGWSQNVVGIIPPTGEVRKHIVLIGHLDTARTPFLFRSVPLLIIFVILVFLVFLSLGVNILLYLLGALTAWSWLYSASWVGAIVQLIGLLFCLEADLSPYTVGANDNASAVGVVLSLAERLSQEPLERSQVWILCSGCEEVACHGVAAFLADHGEELSGAYFIDLEGVGIGELHYATCEGMLKKYPSHPELIAVAEGVAVRRPELGGRPFVIRAGYTETGVVIKRGLKGITLISLNSSGFLSYLPYWHQREDTLDKLEEGALTRAQEFLWEMMKEIDGGPGGDGGGHCVVFRDGYRSIFPPPESQRSLVGGLKASKVNHARRPAG